MYTKVNIYIMYVLYVVITYYIHNYYQDVVYHLGLGIMSVIVSRPLQSRTYAVDVIKIIISD